MTQQTSDIASLVRVIVEPLVEDKEAVSAAFRSMKDKGLYPEQLWHDVDIDNVMWKELKNK